MKRIGLILFIIFIIPIWFVSCYPCGKGGDPGFWTWSISKVDITDNSFELPLSTNDTITTDSVYFNFHLTSLKTTGKTNSQSLNFRAMACDDSNPDQKNQITNLIFTINNISKIDTIAPTIEFTNNSKKVYVWPKDKLNIISELSYDLGYLDKLNCKFNNPHNSKSAQIVITAIKLYGDTITAVSQNVFLK